jgi:hypothetical protein
MSASELRPGNIVEVRSKEEILRTLDSGGALDNLPFMPEMLQYCGKRFSVYKRADKTCDTINQSGGRRMFNTVHLSEMRCDGSAHGECEASCLIFWKEAWLKRVGDGHHSNADTDTSRMQTPRCTESDLYRAASFPAEGKDGAEETAYQCQATRLLEASEPLASWDVRQYWRDACTNDVTLGQMFRSFTFSAYRRLVDFGVGYRALIAFYDWFQSLRGGTPYPDRHGQLTKTPSVELNLLPGELVRVKSYEQILATLNKRDRNQGLYFDAEMVQFCGGTYRVLKQVHRIIDEKTGRMLKFPRRCVILQNAYCKGAISRNRLFCPRSIYPYWREIWLERVDPQGASASTVTAAIGAEVIPRNRT